MVSGKVESSKPISLSKAASTLSTFISTENGASQALCAYLRRASASFNELKQSHKELGISRSDSAQWRPKSGDFIDVRGVVDNTSRSVASQERSEREMKNKEKKKDDYKVVQEKVLVDRMEQPPKKKKKKEHRPAEV